MIALPLPAPLADSPTKAPPAPRGAAYIPLAEAARRSGLSLRTLRAKCQHEWAKHNLAIKAPGADDGQAGWCVREDADPRFARHKSPELLPVDWDRLTEEQRHMIRHRRATLEAWHGFKSEAMARGQSERKATTGFLAKHGGDVSRRTLYRWERAYRASGPAGLLDHRLQSPEARRDGQEFIDELRRLYLSPRKRGVPLCYAMAEEKAIEAGWKVPFGVRRAQQVIDAIPAKVIAYHREGPREYDGSHGRHLVRDYSQLESNQLWVSDGHKFNVFAIAGGKRVRPVLVSWLDMRSRFCTGWQIVAGAENQDVILAAFKSGVEGHGAPEVVYHDNGEAYDAQGLQGVTKAQRRAGDRPQVDLGVFERLGVGVRHTNPYNAKAKPIERWHRTIDDRFSRRWDTYSGGDTASKPHDLQQQLDAGKAPTLEEFRMAFAAWLDADYHHRAHEGDGMDGKTPAQVYAGHLHNKRVIDPMLLDLELCRRQRLKVGRNGVTVRGVTYEAPALDGRTGELVDVLIDDANVGQVKVLDLEGRLLGVAGSVRKISPLATGEELREATASLKRDRRAVKNAIPARLRLADDPIDRMHRIAAQKRQDAPKAQPQAITPIRSKLAKQLPAIKAGEAFAARSSPPDFSTIFADDATHQPASKAPSLADLLGEESEAKTA